MGLTLRLYNSFGDRDDWSHVEIIHTSMSSSELKGFKAFCGGFDVGFSDWNGTLTAYDGIPPPTPFLFSELKCNWHRYFGEDLRLESEVAEDLNPTDYVCFAIGD